MKTWTIREIADACLMTTDELSRWISRGHYRPSEEVRLGKRRRFDWRDLACLAVINALRPHCLSLNAISLIVGSLREELATMDRVPKSPRLFFFDALWSGDEKYTGTCGLVSEPDLCAVLRHRFKSIIIVDVSGVYHAALARLDAAHGANGAAA